MKILIAVPTFENIYPDTFKSIYDLDPAGHELFFEFVRGYDCATARNNIVFKAQDMDVDYVFMVDNDVVLPCDVLKNMLENDDIRNLFIDKCCIFMGDFMNGKGTGATIDLIQAEAMEEFVAHRDKYNPGWGWWPADNRGEITNKFNEAKNWAEGRPNYFYQHIGNQWNLGTPRTLTINKTNKSDVEITFNDIKLSDKVFDGKYFKDRTITLTATANEEGKTVIGWKVTGSLSKEVQGSELTLTMPNGNIAIEPVVGVGSGIEEVSTLNSQLSTLYDLLGNKVQTPQAGKIYIQNGKKVVIK